MSLDDLLKALPVPILTGVFALVGSWFGSWLGKTTEHHQWLRNQKVEVYTNLLRQVHASNLALDHYKETGKDDLETDLSDIKDTTNSRLDVIGSRSVKQEATSMMNVLITAGKPENIDDEEKYEHWKRRRGAVHADLKVAIRKDLGTEEKLVDPAKVRLWNIIYKFTDPFQEWYFERYGVAWTTNHPTRAMKKQMAANGLNPKDFSPPESDRS